MVLYTQILYFDLNENEGFWSTECTWTHDDNFGEINKSLPSLSIKREINDWVAFPGFHVGTYEYTPSNFTSILISTNITVQNVLVYISKNILK